MLRFSRGVGPLPARVGLSCVELAVVVVDRVRVAVEGHGYPTDDQPSPARVGVVGHIRIARGVDVTKTSVIDSCQ